MPNLLETVSVTCLKKGISPALANLQRTYPIQDITVKSHFLVHFSWAFFQNLEEHLGKAGFETFICLSDINLFLLIFLIYANENKNGPMSEQIKKNK